MKQKNIGFKKNSQDIEQVIPNLAVSIAEALTTGVIKDTGTSTPYTKETDVTAVGNYITDKVDIAMAAKNLGQSLASMPTSTKMSEE